MGSTTAVEHFPSVTWAILQGPPLSDQQQGAILAENALVFRCRLLSWHQTGNRISTSSQSLMSVPFCSSCSYNRCSTCSLSYVCMYVCMCASYAGPFFFADFSSPCPGLQSVRGLKSSLLKDLLHIPFCR